MLYSNNNSRMPRTTMAMGRDEKVNINVSTLAAPMDEYQQVKRSQWMEATTSHQSCFLKGRGASYGTESHLSTSNAMD
jgi:hypothetical protein